ncbi:hypothetical protein ACIBBB_02585 [Streptomyces sp. NPDC051217]|uniref:hypothetical protein n=1 Tax=Streptomyces sp. NPDC051217 TaxID=3365644 RepID=UPI0037BB7F2F
MPGPGLVRPVRRRAYGPKAVTRLFLTGAPLVVAVSVPFGGGGDDVFPVTVPTI